MKLFTAIPFLFFFVAASAQENVMESEEEIRILSAYHGLDPLPPLATRLCGCLRLGVRMECPLPFLCR